MKYRILWIDDNVEDLAGSERIIQTRLRSFGFDLHVKYLDEINENVIAKLIAELRANNPYDLIMVDYDLGQAIGGVAVLRRLRNIIHNPMILYSSTAVDILRRSICDAQFDGVFCLGRTELRTQLFPLIQVTLGKLATPAYMRGLIVGTVSEIDGWLVEIGAAILSAENAENALQIKSSIKAMQLAHLNGEVSGLDTVYNLEPPRLMKKLNLHLKKQLLNIVLEQRGCHVSTGCIAAVNDFLEKINPVRIDLAHTGTVEYDGLPALSRKSGGQYSIEDLTALVKDLSLIRDTILNARNHFCTPQQNV